MTRQPQPPAQDAPQASQDTAVAVHQDRRVTAFRKVEAALNSRTDHLMQVLPAKVGVDRFMRVALGAMSRNPTLFDCATESVVKSMLDAAELGLEPSGLMGQAYLVPYRNRGTLEAQLIVGYRGLAELARRSGDVAAVEARVVRQRDTFGVEYGTQPTIQHVPYIAGVGGAPLSGDDSAPVDGAGPLVAVYAVLTLRDGTRIIDVMTATEVDAVRKRSKASDIGPWVTDYLEMARKTVLRRALKYAPVSIVDLRVAEHLEAEDRAVYGQGAGSLGQVAAAAQADQSEGTARVAVSRAAAALAALAAGRQDPDPVVAPVAAQDAPGDPGGPKAESEATDAPAGRPGPSQGQGGFTAADPAIRGQVTGRRGLARWARTPSRSQAEADADVPPGTLSDDSPKADPDAGEVLGQPDALVACEAPSPYGDEVVCLMAKGHRGPHRTQDAAW